MLGSKGGVWISGSTFTNNQASNAGAVGGLFAELNIYNSLFRDNKAIGHDANSNDPSMCDAINNDQNEIGSGGNGGAIYSDGNDVDVNLCGDAILNNAAGTNAFGGGLFFTSNNFGGTLTIADTTMTGNTGALLDAGPERQHHQRRHGRRHQLPQHHHHELDDPGRAVATHLFRGELCRRQHELCINATSSSRRV